jgi:hypothetical protein
MNVMFCQHVYARMLNVLLLASNVVFASSHAFIHSILLVHRRHASFLLTHTHTVLITCFNLYFFIMRGTVLAL